MKSLTALNSTELFLVKFARGNSVTRTKAMKTKLESFDHSLSLFCSLSNELAASPQSMFGLANRAHVCVEAFSSAKIGLFRLIFLIISCQS